MPTCSSRPSRPWRSDDRAVSEVIGQVLIFGILSIVLVSTLIGFGVAKDGATERSIEIRAENIAQTAAIRINEAAFFADQYDADSDVNVSYNHVWNLASDIEGHGFTLDVQTDRVEVFVPRLGLNATSPLSARIDSFDGVEVCDTDPLPGGSLRFVMMTITPSNASQVPAACTTGVHGHRVIFLQEST